VVVACVVVASVVVASVILASVIMGSVVAASVVAASVVAASVVAASVVVQVRMTVTGLGVMVVLVAHRPRMTAKSRCSTSTSATLALLRPHRSKG
jgi:hypothetical protein